MKNLLIILIIALSGCGSVKKLITHSNAKTDSVKVSIRDTSTKKVVVSDQKDLHLNDVDITVEYSDSDTTKAVEVFSKPEIQTLHDVVKSVSGNRVPTKVIIHVGSLLDSGRKTVNVDVATSHSNDSTNLQKKETLTIRDVTKTGLPWWIYVVGGLILLIAIVFFGYRLYRKFTTI